MKFNFKHIFEKLLPCIIAIGAFLIVASIYMAPTWEGESLRRDDIVKGRGQSREKIDYKKYENENIIWSNVIFSGMPEFVYAPYKGATQISKLYSIPMQSGIPEEIALLLWYMIGFYILLLCIKVNPWLAIFGAIAFALTTYNLIIISAGHFTKVYTISLIPPTLGGIFLCFRGKYIWGFIITSLFLAIQIHMSHTQMTYYSAIVVFIIGFVEFVFHVKHRKIKRFGKTIIVLILAALFAIAPNFARLSEMARYNKHSIRGKSELTIGNENVKTESGLDKNYINAWSSGRTEAMMLFVPNVKGGVSSYIKSNENLYKKATGRYKNMIGNSNQYWGNQPFNGAPNYMGAVIFFLFILGLYIIPGKLKYGILISTILLVLLSMGGNLSWFTDLFIDNIPLYNKFRAPVSILAIVAILVSLFAIFTINKIISDPKILEKSKKTFLSKKRMPSYVIISICFVGFLLLNIVFPNLFNTFISNNEQLQFSNIKQNNGDQINAYINALKSFRVSMFRADLLRTLVFALFAFGGIFLFAKKKIKPIIFISFISLIAIIDLWGVGTRYVNHKSFTKRNLINEEYKLTAADKQIYRHEIYKNPEISTKLQEANKKFIPKNNIEKDAILTYIVNKYSNYRVLNVTSNTFNENKTANAHRSIGGYIAYKLRRYQDIIEHHITKNNRQVLNMLNAKYFITNKGVIRNPSAMGHAWFVDSVYWAKDANDEILSLNKINIKNTATINKIYSKKIDNFYPKSENDYITLVTYHPERMVYESNTSEAKLAVFSEIFYPDWEAFIDDKPIKIFNANYILRAAVIPQGKHKIDFIFNPKHFYTANASSQIATYIFIIIILALIGFYIYKNYIKSGIKR